MPLTKAQKTKQIQDAAVELKKSRTLVFVDFTGTSVEGLRKLRADLRAEGATMKVVKKRLLKIALKEAGIDFDPLQFAAQVGTVFSAGDVPGVAGAVYRFSKALARAQGKELLTVLGAYDTKERAFLDANAVIAIGKLPSRDVLLAQVVGGMSAPLRVLLYVLSGRREKLAAAQ